MRLAAAAKRFGFDSDGKHRNAEVRFRRYVLAAERKSGEVCIIRRGTPRMPRYFITISILRQICPELFPRRDEVAEQIREHVDSVEEDLVELRERDAALAKAISAKIDAAIRRISALEIDISRLRRDLGYKGLL